MPVAAEKKFDIELPDEAGEQSEITITEELIAEKGNTLQALALPRGMLVIFVKRDERYIVPNGSMELLPGDQLLVIASAEVEGH